MEPSYFYQFNLPKFVEQYLSYDNDYYNHSLPNEEPFPTSQEGTGFLLFPSLQVAEDELYHTNIPYNEVEQLPCNSISNWPALYESYFDGCWGEDKFSRGYGADDNFSSGFDRPDYPYLGEEYVGNYYSYDSDIAMQPACDYNPWSWADYGRDEDCCCDYGSGRVESAYSDIWDEMKLCESIFGHWPCLLKDYQESYRDQLEMFRPLYV